MKADSFTFALFRKAQAAQERGCRQKRGGMVGIFMRILFSTPDIDSGGSAKSLSILVERLRRRHEVAILSHNPPAPGKPVGRRYRELGIPVFVFRWGWLPVDLVGCPANPEMNEVLCAANRGFLPRLVEIVENFDAICFNSYVTASLAPLLPREMPKYLIAREVLAESGPELATAGALLRENIRRAVAIGPVEAAQLEGLGIEHRTVFNASPERPRFRPLPEGSGLRFGIFSQLLPTKGLDILAMAARMAVPALRRRGASVHIYGGASDQTTALVEKALKDYISAFGLGDVLRMEGWADDVGERMGTVHCVVRPDGTGSPWGRDVIEAMSCGRPVLATGSQEVFVRPGRTGWLVPPQDPEALGRALIHLSGKPELIAKMAGNAFVFAREHFDPDANARQIEEYLFQG